MILIKLIATHQNCFLFKRVGRLTSCTIFKISLTLIILFSGNNSDFGWKSVDDENNRLQNDSTNDNTIGKNYQKVVNRRYENIFIAYATVPGMNNA